MTEKGTNSVQRFVASSQNRGQEKAHEPKIDSGRESKVSAVYSRASLQFIDKNTKFDDRELNSIQRQADELLDSQKNSQGDLTSKRQVESQEVTPLTAAMNAHTIKAGFP